MNYDKPEQEWAWDIEFENNEGMYTYWMRFVIYNWSWSLGIIIREIWFKMCWNSDKWY